MAAVVVALVAGIAWSGGPAASPSPSAVAAATPTAPGEPSSTMGPATASPSASPAASTAASTGAWASLELPPVAPLAELTGDRVAAAGLAADSTFTLHTLDGTPATDLAPRLSVEPAVDLAWTPGSDASRASLRPKKALAEGAVYRFTLERPDGTIGGGWAFRVAGPPRVTGTIPRDLVTKVPVTTGIEFAFDQDGVADPTAWFSLEPAAPGHFELHDRTWVYVPDALRPATVYTATLRAGVPATGSALAMKTPVLVRFETAGPEAAEPPYHLTLGRDVIEVAPGEAPAIGIDVWWTGDEGRLPATVPVDIRRVPDLDAAAAVAAALVGRPVWTEIPRDAVDPSRFRQVAAVMTRLIDDDGESPIRWLQFPAPLDPGWYLVDVAHSVAPGEQALIQVTSIATYLVGDAESAVAWVNRIGGGPVEGATVGVVGGTRVGVTGSDGLLVAKTGVLAGPGAGTTSDAPAGSAPPILAVEAPGLGAAVVPLGISANGPYVARSWWGSTEGQWDPSWISSLAPDRYAYRPTDSIAAWGVVRDRATGGVPAKVAVELRTQAGSDAWDGTADPTSLVVARAEGTPSRAGVVTATLAFNALPLGGYVLALVADGTTIREQWVTVDVIRKPAYSLDFDVDHRAVIAGDPVVATARAVAYDGTPLPGIPIRFDTQGTAREADRVDDADLPTVTTGTDGSASTVFRPAVEGYAQANAVSPELGEIGGGWVSIVAFPASVFVHITKAERRGDAVEVSGTVQTVDLDRVERSLRTTDGWHAWADDVGPAKAGVRVSVRATPTIWVATRDGTVYDFILKRTVPRYTYAEKQLAPVTASATTRTDGTFSLRMTLPAAARGTDASVGVRAEARDPQGRVTTDESTAGTYLYRGPTAAQTAWLDSGPADAPELGPGRCALPAATYPVGGTVRLLFRDANGPLPSGGDRRFLFVASRAGLRDAELRSSPEYVRTLDGDALPNLMVDAVAFDGSAYRASDWSTSVGVDLATRGITVSVTPDGAAGTVRRPGETARIAIRTTDAAGAPVDAEVVVTAVDQKLYDMGMAGDADPVADIWAPLPSGLSAGYLSHLVPRASESPGCGSTTGGGGGAGGSIRDDFRDRAAFVHVRTGSDGIATVPVELPDDLTSWHVTATAVTPDLHAGVGSASIPVGLPFYVEPVAPDVVLATDAPSIVLRSYGSELRSGDTVTYTVTAPGLLPKPAIVTGAAFASVTTALSDDGGPLPLGDHRVTIEGSARTQAGRAHDAKVVTIRVVATRTGTRRATVVTVGRATPVPTADGSMTTCTLTDAGRGSLLPLLDELAADTGPRADQGAAAAAATAILTSEFGRDAATVGGAAFDPSAYLTSGTLSGGPEVDTGPDDVVGLTLLPYGSRDVELNALAALGAPDVIGRSTLEAYLSGVHEAGLEGAYTNDGRVHPAGIIALAGLAALGVPVVPDLHALAARPGLDDESKAWLAVGLAESGDLSAATALLRDVLAASGQRSGGWARVAASTTHLSVTETALLAIAAAQAGDPIASDLAAYVRGEWDAEAVHPLEQVAYAERALDRLPRAAARVAYTIAGERHEVDLRAGGGVSLALTPAQARTTTLDAVTGATAAACSWEAPATTADLPADPAVTVTRTLSGAPPFAAGSFVTVDLHVTLSATAPTGLYRAVTTIPSGLAPTGSLVSAPTTDEYGNVVRDEDAIRPWSIDGNRVEWGVWWAGPDTRAKPIVLRTVLRVVAPGTYTWEPAVVQSVTAPTIGSTVPATRVTVLAP